MATKNAIIGRATGRINRTSDSPAIPPYIQKDLTEKDIQELKRCYIALLKKRPFPAFRNNDYGLVLRQLKRTQHEIGCYQGLTLFETANRIATDLTMFDGVLGLFKEKVLSAHDRVTLRLGNSHIAGHGDFTVYRNGKVVGEGESFDVAPSFLKGKLRSTLRKWNSNNKLKYVVFNQGCVDNSNEEWLAKKQDEYKKVAFYRVKVNLGIEHH